MQPTDDVLHLELTNDVGEVPRLREAAEAMGLLAGFDETRRFDLQLALEEAAVNVIRHAWVGGRHTFGVRLSRTGDGVEAVIEDDGPPFNPLEKDEFDPDTPIEQRRGGGMGIHFIRQLTDELAYSRHSGRNLLRLILRPRTADPDPTDPNT